MFISDIEKSEFIRENFPVNASSAARRRTLYGAAFNDADYRVKPSVGGERLECVAYTTWRDMIQRCLDPVFKSKRPCYVSVSVADEWLSFMAFRSWWVTNAVHGWQLDKDMISDSKVYSPETCLYVPQWLNTFAPERGKTLGVHFDKSRGKYKAYHDVNGVLKNIGRYDSFKDAKRAFLESKIKYMRSRKADIDAVDIRIYPHLLRKLLSAN